MPSPPWISIFGGKNLVFSCAGQARQRFARDVHDLGKSLVFFIIGIGLEIRRLAPA
jgi:hypothetical protein